jgi:hypothetical protein
VPLNDQHIVPVEQHDHRLGEEQATLANNVLDDAIGLIHERRSNLRLALLGLGVYRVLEDIAAALEPIECLSAIGL